MCSLTSLSDYVVAECSSLRANVGATCWSFEDLESWKSAPLSFYFYAKHYTIMNKNL